MALAVAAFCLAVSAVPVAYAQDSCSQPNDIEYLERMREAEQLLSTGEAEEALEEFTWAREHFSYAPIQFGYARALHRLGQMAEAAQAYQVFLLEFESCADPSGMREAADRQREAALRGEAPEDSSFVWAPNIPDEPAQACTLGRKSRHRDIAAAPGGLGLPDFLDLRCNSFGDPPRISRILRSRARRARRGALPGFERDLLKSWVE